MLKCNTDRGPRALRHAMPRRTQWRHSMAALPATVGAGTPRPPYQARSRAAWNPRSAFINASSWAQAMSCQWALGWSLYTWHTSRLLRVPFTVTSPDCQKIKHHSYPNNRLAIQWGFHSNLMGDFSASKINFMSFELHHGVCVEQEKCNNKC